MAQLCDQEVLPAVALRERLPAICAPRPCW